MSVNLAQGEHVIAHEPCWLLAYTVDDLLHVFRSIAMQEDDPDYAPIQRIVGDYSLVSTTSYEDDNMMFRRAEWLMYQKR